MNNYYVKHLLGDEPGRCFLCGEGNGMKQLMHQLISNTPTIFWIEQLIYQLNN